MTTLELLISTLDDGINSVAQLLLPERRGVSYLVSWQHTLGAERCPLPAALNRSDVRVVEMNGTGLSRNRNNCFRHAKGDILLIADDDCRYQPEWFDEIVSTFDSNQSLALATFEMTSKVKLKSYPAREFSLAKPPKGYYITSFEIALRRTMLGETLFDERFGLGSPVFHCCEEELFVEAMVSTGADCRFFPKVVVAHDDMTTNETRAVESGVLAARGAYLWLSHRFRRSAIPRAFLLAWRVSRKHKISLRKALYGIFRGIALIRSSNKN